MNLKNISVKKFAELFDIMNDKGFDFSLDKDIALLACLHDKEEGYFLEMSLPKFKKYSGNLDNFDLKNISAKAPKHIKANGRIYAPVYVFDRLNAGQLLDIMSFCKDPEQIIENLTKILASICLPTRYGLFGRKILRYGAISHKKVAEDMESASIVDAYGIALFFWAVWISFLQNTGDFLVKQTIETKAKTGTRLTEAEKEALLNILQTFGDGGARSKK